nr:hypothetical protein [Tanacetum cinerariifolium]
MMVYLKNMVGFKMDYFKGMSYDDIRPIFEKYFNSNVAFLDKSKEELEEEKSKALKRKTESSEEKAVKKQKLDEEVEELKKHLQIVPNDDDDDVLRLHLLLSSLSLEESKKCSRFSKSQKLEIVRVLWNAYHNIYNYTDDLASKEKISINKRMDGRGAGSYVMLGFAPSSPSFLVSPSVKLPVAGCGGARKGGSCVLNPDLVVMEKVGALGIPARTDYPAHIHQPHRILCRTCLIKSWKRVQALLMVSSSLCLNRRIKSLRAKEEDASSSKRFLPAIARDSF